MDLEDILWHCSHSSQEAEIDQLKRSNADISRRAFHAIQRLQHDNRELKIRVNVLMRLLVEKGLLTADQIHAAIGDEQAKLPAGPQADQDFKVPTKEQIAESKRLFEAKYKK
jgi:hypothetical protein